MKYNDGTVPMHMNIRQLAIFQIVFLLVWLMAVILGNITSGFTTNLLSRSTSMICRWIYGHVASHHSIITGDIPYSSRDITVAILGDFRIFTEVLHRFDLYIGILPIASIIASSVVLPLKLKHRIMYLVIGIPFMFLINALLITAHFSIKLLLMNYFDAIFVSIVLFVFYVINQVQSTHFFPLSLVLLLFLHRLLWNLSTALGFDHGLLFYGPSALAATNANFWSTFSIDFLTFAVSLGLVSGITLLIQRYIDRGVPRS